MVSAKRVYGLISPFVRVFPNPITKTRAPTASDKNFPNGFVWIYKNGDIRTSYTYGGLDSNGDAVWILSSAGGSGIDTLTGNSGGPISPAAGNINIQGVGNIAVSGAGSTLTISDTSGIVFTWNNAATTITMSANNGYIVTAGAQVFTLPATSSVGDSIEILLNGGTSWSIAQTAGQSILVNAAITTVGAGGSILTTAAGQSVRLICVTDNTTWQTTSLIGNPTVT